MFTALGWVWRIASRIREKLVVMTGPILSIPRQADQMIPRQADHFLAVVGMVVGFVGSSSYTGEKGFVWRVAEGYSLGTEWRIASGIREQVVVMATKIVSDGGLSYSDSVSPVRVKGRSRLQVVVPAPNRAPRRRDRARLGAARLVRPSKRTSATEQLPFFGSLFSKKTFKTNSEFWIFFGKVSQRLFVSLCLVS